jgi:CRISPR system Cascade subunit CasD
MTVLLLRLAGPMQSWGVQSRFSIRDSGREPSKSGVVGLLCAALGRPRSEPVDDLAALRMGVRVDREGAVKLDYHTAGGGNLAGAPYGVAKSSGARPETVVSQRYYLADADFLVGLETQDDVLLRSLDAALAAPIWQLSLGRKAFVPGLPIRLPDVPPYGPGLVRDATLEDALRGHPWVADVERPPWQRPERLRAVLEAPDRPDAEPRLDQPIGAAFLTRRFGQRRVITITWTLDGDVPVAEPTAASSADLVPSEA